MLALPVNQLGEELENPPIRTASPAPKTADASRVAPKAGTEPVHSEGDVREEDQTVSSAPRPEPPKPVNLQAPAPKTVDKVCATDSLSPVSEVVRTKEATAPPKQVPQPAREAATLPSAADSPQMAIARRPVRNALWIFRSFGAIVFSTVVLSYLGASGSLAATATRAGGVWLGWLVLPHRRLDDRARRLDRLVLVGISAKIHNDPRQS